MKLQFDSLSGLSLMEIGHAADMVWIALAAGDAAGETPPGREICVDIQSQVEILLDGVCIATTADIFELAGEACKFDQLVSAINENHAAFRLESAAADESLCLVLAFSNGLQLRTKKDEAFALDEERWRIFRKRSGMPHLVAMGDRLEI